MAKLILLKFEPMYPVCDGELIFFTNAATDAETQLAIQEIQEIYLRWVDADKVTVCYLGTFEPAHDDQFENNVISFQNGNY